MGVASLTLFKTNGSFPSQQTALLAFLAFTRDFSLKLTPFQLLLQVQLEAPGNGPSSQNHKRNGRMAVLKAPNCHIRSLEGHLSGHIC